MAPTPLPSAATASLIAWRYGVCGSHAVSFTVAVADFGFDAPFILGSEAAALAAIAGAGAAATAMFSAPSATSSFGAARATDSSLANAFVHGFRLDVSPWRGRAHIGELPDLAQKIKTLLEIKEKYRRLFYGGAYVYDRPATIPACVKSGCFADGNDRIYTLWNDSQTAQTFELCGSTVTLAAQETRVFEA